MSPLSFLSPFLKLGCRQLTFQSCNLTMLAKATKCWKQLAFCNTETLPVFTSQNKQ